MQDEEVQLVQQLWHIVVYACHGSKHGHLYGSRHIFTEVKRPSGIEWGHLFCAGEVQLRRVVVNLVGGVGDPVKLRSDCNVDGDLNVVSGGNLNGVRNTNRWIKCHGSS